MDFKEIQKRVYLTAKNNGFHQIDGSSMSQRVCTMRKCEILMLIVTECAEACEAVRLNDDNKFQEDLADIVMRVMDTAELYGINLEEEIIKKNWFKINSERGYMHGGKAC